MCLLFVIADVEGPSLLWHMIPGIRALNGYLFLNITIPFYILFSPKIKLPQRYSSLG
ncbi:MAG: hypothetical protein PVJ91_01525 [Flavobacteriaceae bacterium]|jgi:molybdopterin-containing oxidoreductase family membrane subunit